ncbi:lipopolysaccharide biosynthesis protein [Paenisporosarcina sp. TG-14]|uniref:lipopolysaccharide biosynthesis protein n=1 Tax=Paenisporosarcina sp. TG-14 TaxID=1231057 RepID=UPI0002F5C72A|nr:oligosaccharide flippase family protein [Paenisporosarcina sp. TG-14]
MENKNSRTANSLRNTVFGMISQVLIVLLNFGVRTVFIHYLSIEYLGVNGLFTNILTLLSLAELGFGSAMIYSMYKPVAEENKRKIAALMNLYKKVYIFIGLTVAGLGLLLVPFLDNMIKETPNVDKLTFIYLLFLLNTVVSYFFAYSRSIITAHQKEYIVSKVKLYTNIFRAVLQIVILVLTQDFILYLGIQIVSTLLENIVISIKAKHLYPYLKKYKKERLDASDKKNIWTNVKALVIYKLGSTVMDGMDNIIIAAYIGVAAVGKLSNYTLILGSVAMVVLQFTNAITASVGNFIVKENGERQEFLLKTITFANFIIYGFSFICLVSLLNPFIELWIGKEYILGMDIVFIVSLNWYIFGMMNSIWTFRSTMGLFVHGKYRPAVSAVINLILSIYLVRFWGLFGVLVATSITRIITNVWFDPLIVYKHGLKKGVISYYFLWVKYLLVAMLNIVLIQYLFSFIHEVTILSFLFMILICISVISVIFIAVFIKTVEYIYLATSIKNLILQKFN